MDTQVVKDLIREFKAADLTKLSLKYEGLEISLEREDRRAQEQNNISLPNQGDDTNGTNNVVPSNNVATTNVNVKHIKSPIVGTFYASSTLEGEPYVTVGSKVKKGDIVCIIEAMKLMNEIEADSDGEILEILVQNEEMVEFDQPLFVIG